MTDEKDEFEKLRVLCIAQVGNLTEKSKIANVFDEIVPKLKAQILAENPMAGLTDAELIYLNKLSEHVSNPVFSKFIVELSRRREKKEEAKA